MNYKIIIITILLIVNKTNAQTNLVISGGNWVNGNSNLVLKDTKFTNNSTFHAGSGTVIITGNGTTAQSEIGGTSQTTFYKLTMNKSANNALLSQDVTISNLLSLTSGQLEINNNNLTIENTGTISGGNTNSYIKTAGTGTLIQEVGASNTVFPVGNSSYTPVMLNNAGTTDNFNVRVENTVYMDGTSGSVITTDVVNATWLIGEATANGSDITATFQWNASDELTDFDRTQSFIANYNNDKWNNGATQAATGSNPYTLTMSGITNLSSFIVASDATVLPVELLYFYGEKEGANVRLSWQTATEINNSHFDVEWSKDGIDFIKIGEVAGGGTTNEVQFYDFLHDANLVGFQNLQGLNYYRLRQVDFDEKYEYTNIINITIDQYNNTAIKLYPNPTSHYLNLESKELVGEVAQVFNVHGQLVKEFIHQSLITNLSITNLPSGTYFVKIRNQVKKIIIQK